MPHKDPAVRREYLAAYREKHAERLAEQNRLYRLAHREEIAERWRKWHSEHPDQTRAASRKAQATWIAKYPDKVRAKVARRRALIGGRTVEYVSPVAVYERDGGICGICRFPVDPSKFHIDHIVPVSRGGEHSYANVQVAHPSCNHRKGSRLEPAA